MHILAACLHCGDVRRRYARALCATCYHNHVIRRMYPRLKESNGTPYRYFGDADPKPTDELPGSVGKVAVLEGRVARNERLWCAGDAVHE